MACSAAIVCPVNTSSIRCLQYRCAPFVPLVHFQMVDVETAVSVARSVKAGRPLEEGPDAILQAILQS
jgi:hypothetical protein